MADTTVNPLHESYSTIRVELGFFLGYDRDPTAWTTDQAADVERYIKSGLQMYYYPPPNPATQGLGYEWSFLKPWWTLDTVSGQRRYTMPHDFERFISSLVYRNEDSNNYPPIVSTSAQRLREMEANHDDTGTPAFYAIESGSSGGETQQRWTLALHPTPDAEYLLAGQYASAPLNIGTSNPYPLGGTAHSYGVKLACMAAAEEGVDGARGIKYQQFMERLVQDILMDIRRSSGRNLGYNGDSSSYGPSAPLRSQARNVLFIGGDNLTYNGVDAT